MEHESLKTIYGPVPSRRLGLSLGIDPFTQKTCTHSCIYCQLGRAPTVSAESTIDGVNPDLVKSELAEFFASDGKADYITFSGSGEPTLWGHIGELIKFIKEEFAEKKVCVLTNGTTLWRKEVREALMLADLVVPTVAAADRKTYIKLHRPHPSATLERHIEGVKKFAEVFGGSIWAEVMLVAGINDSDEHLRKLAELLDGIPFEFIDINLPVRPPAESWVKPPEMERVEFACRLVGERCRVVGKFRAVQPKVERLANLAEKVLEILMRRPEKLENIADALAVTYDEARKAIDALIAKKLVTKTTNDYFKLTRDEG